MRDAESSPTTALLDAVNAGLIMLNSERRIVTWNAWMTRASRQSLESVVGKSLSEVFPAVDVCVVETAVSSAIETGAPSILTHALHPTVLPLITGAGGVLLHNITVSAIAATPRNSCLIYVADVTMATRRERYLRDRQNARYDAVVASAPDVILTLDGEGIIHLANPSAAQFGYAPNELVGHDAGLLFETQGAWRQIWGKVVAGDKADRPVEVVVRRKDGTISFFEVSASRWQSDSRIFVTAILRNTNERREAEMALRSSEGVARASAEALANLNATLEQRVAERTAELMHAEEALRQSHKMEAIGQLTGGIAHDFNNLLQGIIGALHMVQKRVASGRVDEIDRFLQGALRSANRASALTHRLLAFARRQPVDPRPLRSNQLIGSIEELLRRSIGEEIKVIMSLSPELWIVRCDANQLENALLNLAINARDAMPGGGTLTIETSNITLGAEDARSMDVAAGDYVRVAMTDTGTGMPPDVQSRVFEPFYTTKPIGRGTGLGLSMIYGFVRQSQGSVRIQSEQGRGTTIELVLPRFSGDITDTPSGVNAPQAAHPRSEEVVLVVEDDEVVRLVVVEVLNEEGYHALEAVDGTAALRILKTAQRIDLLVTDVGLPDINGRELADAGRLERPDLKVLFMTGYAEKAAGSAFLEAGMEILMKPFLMEDLAAKLRGMLTAPHR
jgi:PAS domain S-box-containing protein